MMRALSLCLAAAAAPAALAQTGELFINQFDNNSMLVVQGGSVIRSWNTINTGENALAVAGTIRTAGNKIFATPGFEYDLNGVPLGPSYSIALGGNYYDGTTDGVNYNYAIQHNGDYMLYRFDREWANPQALFAVSFPDSGVAYDPSDGTIWVSTAFSPAIKHYALDGTLLGSFPVAGSYAYGLALDPTDNTLWVGGFASNVIYQYDKSGNQLSSVTVPGVTHAFGMEFSIPAPGAAALLAIGGLAAARRRR